MKFFLAIISFMSLNTFADIPNGRYLLDKIVCSNGEELKMGGKFISYQITLDVAGSDMEMTAVAVSNKWAPFKVNCTQINRGKFSYVGDNQYEGSLPMDEVTCNSKMWIGILKKQHFGVEEEGLFDYSYENGKLVTSNQETITTYSCGKTGSYPIYYYSKK